MSVLRKHIAFFLFGIFFFSITYQSLHEVGHHSHNCDSHSTHNHNKLNKTKHGLNIYNLSQEDKSCLICDYRFSINDYPRILSSSYKIPEIPCNYKELETQQKQKLFYSTKTPRAPPV